MGSKGKSAFTRVLERVVKVQRTIVASRDTPLAIVRLDSPFSSSALGNHLTGVATAKRVMFSQAYLKLDGSYGQWCEHPSRRNVRKSIRLALSNGMTTRSVHVEDAYEMWLAIERDRGAVWSPPGLPLRESSHQLTDNLTIGTWNLDGKLIALVYGVRAGNVLKVFLAVGSTRSDGARWLCLSEFIRLASEQGVDTFLFESRVGLAPGLIHFQNMFGFESRTVILAKQKAPRVYSR